MNAFAILNVPISWGFILAAPTPANTIFWNWVNQSYNAMMNYGNRNASSNYTKQDVFTGYFLAVTSSIAVAVTMRSYLKPYTSKLSGGKLGIANCVSSCTATAIAGILNSLAMRNREIRNGIDIKDENG